LERAATGRASYFGSSLYSWRLLKYPSASFHLVSRLLRRFAVLKETRLQNFPPSDHLIGNASENYNLDTFWSLLISHCIDGFKYKSIGSRLITVSILYPGRRCPTCFPVSEISFMTGLTNPSIVLPANLILASSKSVMAQIGLKHALKTNFLHLAQGTSSEKLTVDFAAGFKFL
jgi:hypothetical protein